MKIRPISDLHSEHGFFSFTYAGEDVMVLGGDLGNYTNYMSTAKSMAVGFDIPVIVLAGNHEFYSDPTDTYTWTNTLDDLKAAVDHTDRLVKGDVTFFEDSCAVYDGVRFIGATLWTDMKLFGDDWLVALQVEKTLNDYHCIRTNDGNHIFAQDTIDRHNISLAYITKKLSEPFDGKTVVVTHHAPSWLSIHEDYRLDKTSAAYASRLENLILDYNPELWTHGHTHESCDYTIGNTRVVCNPFGYMGSRVNPNFNPNLLVQI
jgi:predicted phosphodiesterase